MMRFTTDFCDIIFSTSLVYCLPRARGQQTTAVDSASLFILFCTLINLLRKVSILIFVYKAKNRYEHTLRSESKPNWGMVHNTQWDRESIEVYGEEENLLTAYFIITFGLVVFFFSEKSTAPMAEGSIKYEPKMRILLILLFGDFAH